MYWKLQENVLSQSDLDLLVSFIRETKRFTQFERVKQFENEFAEWQGSEYCVFVNSGSSANFILISALKELCGWNDGDEIIVPAITWPTTVTPIIQLGLNPVFVDINLDDLSFIYDRIESKITTRTRGIFVVHLLGFPADMQRLKELVNERDILIIEDCCESHGAKQKSVKVGNFGMAGTFSSYWGHHITTIEGGMVTTNNEDLYNLLLLKRSHGLARELPNELHSRIKAKHQDIDFNFLFLTDGFNFRNTEFNAMFGLLQLKGIDGFITIRNRNYDRFISICKRFPDHLITLDSIGKSSFSLPFFFKNYEQKQAFQKCILNAGIEYRPIIGGNLLRQPFLKKYYNKDQFKNSDFIHSNAFYIGNNQFVNQEKVDYLDKLMSEYFNYYKGSN